MSALNPAAAALQARFGDAVGRVEVSCGDTIVHLAAERLHEALAWLQADPDQAYDYLVDVTAVEYRDRERALEVVYQLWSLGHRRFLRVKVALDKDRPLEVPTVTDLWKGADWMEREVWDMFGIRFTGHPDLRRILMWETYSEGFPLRKDFPLRGRFSRSEQVRRALSDDLEKHYSMDELAYEEAAAYLPEDVKRRLASGTPPEGQR